MTTDERIENLEKGLASARRRNRWLLAAVGLALGVGILVAGTFWPKIAAALAGGGAIKEVRANRFVVEDENGKNRIVLAASKEVAALSLNDENGNARALLVAKEGPAMVLSDANGKTIVQLVGRKGGALFLSDENGTPGALLAASKGEPALRLWDENGKTRVVGAVLKNRSYLALADENGKATWQAP